MKYVLMNEIFPQYSTIEQVLTNRGIPYKDIEHYLNTTDNDIHDPSLIANIHEAVVLIMKHIKNNSKVFLQIDSDCDGFTSASIFLNYLYRLFPAFVQNNITYRVHNGKQHGLILDSIPEDVNLVIALDASSNDYLEHETLAHRGIDVLVIDHHEAEKISPYACIVNNQLCDYPNKALCGAGMVYKFCCYFDRIANTEYSSRFLDLTALGLIADMMSLRDFETKHLIGKGLKNLENLFFRAMFTKNKFSIGPTLTPIGVAFYIAPYVNATIRMGTVDEKIMLFESMLDFKALEELPSTKRGCKGQKETRVEQACRNCTNIKSRQTKARDAALASVESIIQSKNLLENKILVVKLENVAIDKNITGLIANQLMSKYQRPVLLLHKKDNGEDHEITWEGSGRGYDKSSFDNLREFLLYSELVNYAEGHANALGVGIDNNQFKTFMEFTNLELSDVDFSPSYKVDYIFNAENFQGKYILDIAALQDIWGQGVDEPYIAIENIKINKDNLILMSRDKNPTLKINMSNGVSLIKFKSSEDEYDKLYSDLGCVIINVVGRCARNEWNGIITPQLIIENYEIVNKQQYCF